MAETLHLAGLTEVQAAPVLARLLLGRGGAHGGNGGADAGSGPRALIVTAGQGTARSFAKNLSFFLKRDVLALPEDDPPFLRYEARSRETEAARRAAMDALLFEDAAVVVCPVSALIKRTLCPDAFSALTLTIRQGETADPEELNRRLFAAGYQRTPYTENPGEFSRRGGILDVFPIGADAPCRVEFFDTEIERIRRFDPDTQTSTGAADFVRIPPAGGGHDGEGFERAEGGGEYGADAEYGGGFARGAEYGGGAGGDEDEDCCLADWIGAADFFAVVDPGRVEQSLALRETEAAADFAALLENGEASAGD
ncbi:MAG: hypothetical protein LBS85_01135, partial [Clostridiales Family XIII bacterium]|nr:hypothetical protein [Clostridiales Family XIII bacterium]